MAKRKKTPDRIRNLIIVSDLHCGCRVGLCPNGPIHLDDGGEYTPSENQKKVWSAWETFWGEWVPEVCHGEQFAVVVNGDALDGVHHGSKTQVSQNHSDQQRIAKMVLEPIRDLCEGRLFMIRGTEAHVGQSAEYEEMLAEHLEAIPSKTGQRSHYELWLRVGNGLVHIMHHIGTSGSQHYEGTAITKELTELYTEAGRWRHDPPDVVVRAHRHRHFEVRVPTKLGYGISFTTAAWQLKTPFAFKVAGARITTPQIGGSVIRQGDTDLYTRHKVWDIGRPEEIVL